MISSFHIRTHREKESLEPIEKNHHATKELDKEADGEKTAITVDEVISEAVAEENSVADSPSKIHILEGAKHKSIKIYLWETLYPCTETTFCLSVATRPSCSSSRRGPWQWP